MTARQRIARAVAENFEQHVRATAEIAGLLITRVRGGADRAEELASAISACEETYKRLVYDEAMRRLGITVGRRGRRRLQEGV